MTATHWHDTPQPDSMADALNNILWALGQMLDAIDENRYRYERVHVEADLRYLRAEAIRAKRQRHQESGCRLFVDKLAKCSCPPPEEGSAV